jgi:predicted transcriptional regulator
MDNEEELLEALTREYSEFRKANPSPARLPKKLKEKAKILIDLGISQRAIAEACKVTDAAVSYWIALAKEGKGRPLTTKEEQPTKIKEEIVKIKIDGREVEAPVSIIKKILSRG